MKAHKKLALCGFLIASSASMAAAAPCDWRPSQFFGTTTAAVAGGSALAIGSGMKAAGFYTLIHAGSGLTMLGSTMAGASAAGTVGIIAGTGGVIGTISAILMAPVTVVIGGAIAVGGAGFETVCHFSDERITEYSEVLAIMQHLDEHHDAERFQLVTGIPGRQDDAIRIWNPETEELDRYLVADLYLVNGRLWATRSWRFDQDLGMLLFVQPSE
ncbi:MAG: hypothetical protein HLUCCA12_17895 [Rhodobacteraceae bacterium HLUCCA12]|nr:MAG: hypothetical protein HLUCCA12_17895 [Rhodobacteraceae bacterium HLUCCA12]